MFNGYLALGGNEILNAARTAAYVKKQLPRFDLHDVHGNADLQLALGDEDYESPLADDAPWMDESNPATKDFYGLYPLAIQGIGGSTRGAAVSESIVDGGVVGSIRHASREIRVKALLIAADDMGLEAGRAWLSGALDSSECGSHGGACGASDLDYFIAAPRIQPGAVDENQPVDLSYRFGSVAPATSPINHRFIQSEGPASVEWEVERTDGAIVQWGARAVTTPQILEQHAPVVLRRTNVIPNPAQRRNVRGYSVTAGAEVSWVAAGGPGDSTFGRVRELAPPVVRVNYFPDPNGDNDPRTAGWETNSPSPLASTPDRDAPESTRVLVALGGAPGDIIWVENTIPIAARGPGALGVSVNGHALGAEVIVTNTSGERVGYARIPAGTTYTRVEIPVELSELMTVRVQAQLQAGEDLRIDAGLLEAAAPGGRFFDGVARDADSGYGMQPYGFGPYGGGSSDVNALGAVYSWQNGTPFGPSVETIGTSVRTVLTLPTFDIARGPATLSLAMRAGRTTAVTLRTRSSMTNQVLAESAASVVAEWERYAFQLDNARGTYLELVFEGSIDFAQLDLEVGQTSLGYFDGNTDFGSDYSVEWIGGETFGFSRMTYLPALTTSREDSDWRPFFQVTLGSVPSVTLEVRQYVVIDQDLCVADYERSYHGVTCIEGPTPTKEFAPRVGAMEQVEFLLRAESPRAYGRAFDLFTGPLSSQPKVNYADVACDAPLASSDVTDPQLPVVPPPPRPPFIADPTGSTSQTSWSRRTIVIEADRVAGWSATLPLLTITSREQEIRKMRVRVYPNPFDYAPEDIDPCSWCSEFIISYLPKRTELVMDGRMSRAMASVAGAQPVTANHLLYGTDGAPMSWPELSCGISYVLAVDVPPTSGSSTPDVQLALQLARRE
jgi:hypothetical protein